MISAAIADQDFFAALEQAVIVREPYPHAIIDDVLEPALADRLVRAMAGLERLVPGFAEASNQRFNLTREEAAHDPRVPAIWRALLDDCMSQRFLDRVLRLFANDIRRELPAFEATHGALDSLVAHPRNDLPWPARALGVQSQLAFNSPVLEPGPPVRGAHLDMPKKLFFGMLYMRPDGDHALGGDLELLVPTRPIVFQAGRNLPPDAVRVAKTVAYRRNRMVLILNTPRSLHAVTPRAVTPHARYFVNVIGETQAPLFPIVRERDLPRSWWRRLLRRPR